MDNSQCYCVIALDTSRAFNRSYTFSFYKLILFLLSVCAELQHVVLIKNSGKYDETDESIIMYETFFWLCVSLIKPVSHNIISGLSRTFGAHGQRTLRGPFPYFITLFLWSLPHIHPYSDFAHVYRYCMILNTALFNQYISHGVFWKFGSFWWRNGGNGSPLMTQS